MSLLFYYIIRVPVRVHPSHKLRQLIAMTDPKCAQIFEHFAKHTEEERSLMISSAVLAHLQLGLFLVLCRSALTRDQIQAASFV